jgi:hypothetical protein
MKPIKITSKNAEAIEAELKRVNGKAHKHAYTDYPEILQLTINAQVRLGQLLYVKDWAGARWGETSGAHVANAYNYMREATRVLIERRSKDWFLIDVQSARIGSQGGGAGHLYLTPEQDAAAKAKLEESYITYCPEQPQ